MRCGRSSAEGYALELFLRTRLLESEEKNEGLVDRTDVLRTTSKWRHDVSERADEGIVVLIKTCTD